MGAISFREANASDAAALGAVHVASWRETYAGILPDELLAGLSVEARSAMWSEILGAGAASMFVAECEGAIVGFGACGAQRDDKLQELGFDAEFGAIYVLRSHQRIGVGRALMGMLARELQEQGRRAANLWVLRENVPARAFYERLGGTLVGERVDEVHGSTVIEVAYAWSDLAALAGGAGVSREMSGENSGRPELRQRM